MDGVAISQIFAGNTGPDCLKEVVEKYGNRVKVYTAIKNELEKNPDKEVWFVVYFLSSYLTKV